MSAPCVSPLITASGTIESGMPSSSGSGSRSKISSAAKDPVFRSQVPLASLVSASKICSSKLARSDGERTWMSTVSSVSVARPAPSVMTRNRPSSTSQDGRQFVSGCATATAGTSTARPIRPATATALLSEPMVPSFGSIRSRPDCIFSPFPVTGTSWEISMTAHRTSRRPHPRGTSGRPPSHPASLWRPVSCVALPCLLFRWRRNPRTRLPGSGWTRSG